MSARKGSRRKNPRSPINEAFGRVLEGIRTERQWPPEFLPAQLELAMSYYRAIELGTRNLPPRAAAPLSEALGTDFMAVSALLVAMDNLELKTWDNSSLYDFDKIKARAEHLKVRAPHLAPILDWLIMAIADLDAEAAQYEQIIDAGGALLRNALLKEAPTPGTSPPVLHTTRDRKRACDVEAPSDSDQGRYDRLAGYDLNPAFADLLDTLATNLSFYAPLMTVRHFQDWETSERARVLEIRSYVKDVKNLVEQASDFDWSTLRNSSGPTITIFIPKENEDGISADEVQKRLRAEIRRQLRNPRLDRQADITNRLEVIALEGDGAWDHALLFDVVHRVMPSRDESEAVKQQRLKAKRYERFNNAWVYRVRVSTADPRDQRERLIGFLGAHVQGDPTASFVGLMDRQHVEYCWKLLAGD